ncbi:MAG: c-type cytochrome [Chloroflexota bacterium]
MKLTHKHMVLFCSCVVLVLLMSACTIQPITADIEMATSDGADSVTSTSIELMTPDGAQTFTLENLQAQLEIATITVETPAHKKNKTFEGFWLSDILALTGMTKEDLAGGDEDYILFEALDGYQVRLNVNQLADAQPQGLLAYDDVDTADGWELVKQGQRDVSPGPFYLVWTTTDGSELDSKSRPWPYQLAHISSVNLAELYDLLYPVGIDESDPIFQGFTLFEVHCVKCHGFNLQGGKVGPELNIPQNVTEYRDRETLIGFIKNSSNYRLGSAMPVFDGILADEEIDLLLTYIEWMGDNKIEPYQ